MDFQLLGAAADGALEAETCLRALSEETRRLGSNAMADYYARKADGAERAFRLLREQWHAALKAELARLDAEKQK